MGEQAGDVIDFERSAQKETKTIKSIQIVCSHSKESMAS